MRVWMVRLVGGGNGAASTGALPREPDRGTVGPWRPCDALGAPMFSDQPMTDTLKVLLPRETADRLAAVARAGDRPKAFVARRYLEQALRAAAELGDPARAQNPQAAAALVTGAWPALPPRRAPVVGQA